MKEVYDVIVILTLISAVNVEKNNEARSNQNWIFTFSGSIMEPEME